MNSGQRKKDKQIEQRQASFRGEVKLGASDKHRMASP